jgi:beta-lactamase regulating signal transducer with metallopeptidase domain
MTSLISLANGFPGLVLDFLLRSAALGFLCASVLWLFRFRDAAWQYAICRLALFAMLILPLAGISVPQIRVPTPFVMQLVSRAVKILPDRPLYPNREDTRQHPRSGTLSHPPDLASQVSSLGISWALIGLAFYSLIATGMICRVVVGWLLIRRTALGMDRLDSPFLLERVNRHCSGLGLIVCPELRAGPAVSVPVTFGWTHPVILLPADWPEWPEEKLDLVLVHELSHVRRGDYLIRVASAANKSLYWFHPLSWLLDRRLAELGELLSDDAALFASPASRAQYAAILSGFMNSLDHMAYRSRVGIAMSVSSCGDRRINRVLDGNRILSAGLGFRQRLPLFCLGIPMLILLAGIRPMTLSGVIPKAVPAETQTAGVTVNAHDFLPVTQSPPRRFQLTQEYPPMLSPLVVRFRDTHYIPEKEQLLNQMAQNKSEAVGKQLLSLAKTTNDGDTRWLAIRGLGMLKFKPAAPFLIESLQSSERYVRANSARALGELEYSAAIPALVQLLAVEQDGGVIEQASLALRMTKAVGAVPTLESRMSQGASQTPQTQCWLLDAIAGLGSEHDLPFIAKYLYESTAGNVGVESCAASAMSTLSGEVFDIPKLGLVDPMISILKARTWWENRQ